MTALFVTATGTDVGKTYVTAGVARGLLATGRMVDAIKPVVSGFEPATVAESDPGILLAALGRPITPAEIARISPWRYRAPLSPDMAARQEGRQLDFPALVQFCLDALAARRDALLIEGVGGIMVPLTERHTVLDWMTALRLPVLLVCGSYLGTLSHTLSAVDVLNRRELAIAAIVVSETVDSTVPLTDSVATIARFVRPIVVIELPRVSDAAQSRVVFDRLIERL